MDKEVVVMEGGWEERNRWRDGVVSVLSAREQVV